MNVLLRIGVYLALLPLALLIAGLYGALHDQISYTVSPEYFTRFKFLQFAVPWGMDAPRLGAAWVGMLATWWMGGLVFLILGLFGFLFPTPGQMAAALLRSFLVVMALALLTGLIGLGYGYWKVNASNIGSYMQWVWPGVSDPVQFVRTGFMHDASYLGGLSGLIAGIVYLLRIRP